MATLKSIAGPHGLRRRRQDARVPASTSGATVVPAQDGHTDAATVTTEQRCAGCHDITFSPAQCLKTFIYEALPMYSSLPVVLFIECVLGRRSVGAALTLARNRMLYVTSEILLVPVPAQILLYLLPNWCMVGGLVVWYYDADAQQLFDSWELLVMWLVVLMRHFVVALKYGYLSPSEIAAQYSTEYGGIQLAKGIFLGGWATPMTPGFGIVQEEMTTAMWLCDVDLQRCPLRFKSTPGHPGTMNAYELGMRIASRCYGKPLAASATPIALLTGIALPFLPAIARAASGLPAFGGGGSLGPKLVSFCQIWGPFSYIWLMCAYHRLSLHSYNRRAKAMELFDALCSVGIDSAELTVQPEQGQEQELQPEQRQEQELQQQKPSHEPIEEPKLAQSDRVRDLPVMDLDLDAAEASLITPRSDISGPSAAVAQDDLSLSRSLPSAHLTLDLTDPTTVVSIILLRRCLRHYVRFALIGSLFFLRRSAFTAATDFAIVGGKIPRAD